jgi:hypothetical protein
MTVDEFMAEHDATCHLGFKLGADMVLKMTKLVMPKDLYAPLEKSVHESEPYLEGKKQQEAAAEHAAKKQKEYGHER